MDLSVIKNYLFDIAGNGRLMGNNNIFCALVDVNFTPENWVIWSKKNRSAQVVLEVQLSETAYLLGRIRKIWKSFLEWFEFVMQNLEFL